MPADMHIAFEGEWHAQTNISAKAWLQILQCMSAIIGATPCPSNTFSAEMHIVASHNFGPQEGHEEQRQTQSFQGIVTMPV